MNMFKGLLFLDGHFTRPDDLDDAPRAEYGARTAAADFAAPLGNRAATAAWLARSANRPVASEAVARRSTASKSKPRANVLESLLYLGGRPMHAGHNTDVEEPFEQLVEQGLVVQGAAPERRNAQPDRRRTERRNAQDALPQACNG